MADPFSSLLSPYVARMAFRSKSFLAESFPHQADDEVARAVPAPDEMLIDLTVPNDDPLAFAETRSATVKSVSCNEDLHPRIHTSTESKPGDSISIASKELLPRSIPLAGPRERQILRPKSRLPPRPAAPVQVGRQLWQDFHSYKRRPRFESRYYRTDSDSLVERDLSLIYHPDLYNSRSLRSYKEFEADHGFDGPGVIQPRRKHFSPTYQRQEVDLIDLSSDIEMADFDSRPTDREGDRHRGGGGGGSGKKRRFREDDDYDRRPQRPRFNDSPERRLRGRLLHMGEGGRAASDDSKDLARIYVEGANDSSIKERAIDLILQIANEQPFKIPFVASVVLNLNDTHPDLAREIVDAAGTRAQIALEDGAWREFKLTLRFLACVHSLFEGDGIFPLLVDIFDSAAGLQAESSEDTVGLELVKIILLTIPYAMAYSTSQFSQNAADLLEKTEIVASAPHALEPLVEAYAGDSEEKPFGYLSVIGLLQKQLQREASKDWELSFLPRIYSASRRPENANSDGTTDGEVSSNQHAFPNIMVPSPVNPGPKPLFPEAFFSIYADQEVETVPRTSDLAACLIRDACVDTINLLHFNRAATAKFLIEIDSFWAPETFAQRATPFDKLRDATGDRSTWKPEDIAIDAVFSQILLLPTPEHKLVYYHSVITDSCKLAPSAVAPTLGRAIRFLFKNSDLMDMDLIARFMDWFAHHLSNFDFRWKWTEWIEDLNLPLLHPKRAFIAGALDKEIRLSFAKRIRDTLPAEYHPLIPESKEKEKPDFKYKDDNTPFANYGRELLALIRKKADDATIQITINQIQEEAAEHGVTEPLIPSTDAYVSCILEVGAKSLSHVLSCIERHQGYLQKVQAESDAARLQIVTSVVEYWREQPGTAINIIDKLLNYQAVTPMTIVQWVLSPERLGAGQNLAQTWIYEMVSNTISKVTNRVGQVADANLKVDLPQDQIELLQDALVKERQDMRELFKVIEDATAGIASGAKDELVSMTDDAEIELLKNWGEKWRRAFARKGAVEEALVGEKAMEERKRVVLEEIKRKQEEAERQAAAETEKSAVVEMDVSQNGEEEL